MITSGSPLKLEDELSWMDRTASTGPDDGLSWMDRTASAGLGEDGRTKQIECDLSSPDRFYR